MRDVLPCHVIETPDMKLFVRAVVDEPDEPSSNGHRNGGPPSQTASPPRVLVPSPAAPSAPFAEGAAPSKVALLQKTTAKG